VAKEETKTTDEIEKESEMSHILSRVVQTVSEAGRQTSAETKQQLSGISDPLIRARVLERLKEYLIDEDVAALEQKLVAETRRARRLSAEASEAIYGLLADLPSSSLRARRVDMLDERGRLTIPVAQKVLALVAHRGERIEYLLSLARSELLEHENAALASEITALRKSINQTGSMGRRGGGGGTDPGHAASEAPNHASVETAFHAAGHATSHVPGQALPDRTLPSRALDLGTCDANAERFAGDERADVPKTMASPAQDFFVQISTHR